MMSNALCVMAAMVADSITPADIAGSGAVVNGADGTDSKQPALDLAALPDDTRKRVFGAAAAGILVDKARQDINLAGVDYAEVVGRWLATYDSKYTRDAYARGLARWGVYCEENGIDPLRARSVDADGFAAWCREQFAASMANLAINSTASFYSIMVKWEVLPRTPFIRVRRARVVDSVKRIPTLDEIQDTITAERRAGRAGVADAIEVLAITGMRVGALPLWHRNEAGAYWTTSKSRAVSGQLPAGCAIRAQWAGVKADTIAAAIKTAFKRRGMLYSAHDLRHAFAVRLYKQSGNDIYRVSRALAHRSIETTATYLRGLGVFDTGGADDTGGAAGAAGTGAAGAGGGE